MSTWEEVAAVLSGGGDLSYEQTRAVMKTIMAGELDEIRLSAFLSMLAVRGVGVTELRGLADQMRASAEAIDLPNTVVDIVGTGGDKANTVNISTMASLVIAASGFPVVKHGNRASTSACGSADLLEELGVDLSLPTSKIASSFEAAGIAFLFANKFHPSMRHAARVRRELGFPTAFNILGPLTNPVAPSASAVGVAQVGAAPLVAGVFAERGTSAFVFRGARRGLDELTSIEPAQLWAVGGGQGESFEIDPAAILDLPRGSLADLRGGSAAANAEVAREVMSGKRGVIFDAVAMNAAIGIMAGQAAGLGERRADSLPVDPLTWLDPSSFARGLQAAFEVAVQTLESGSAAATLQTWVAATAD